jgi:hypothetical protein
MYEYCVALEDICPWVIVVGGESGNLTLWNPSTRKKLLVTFYFLLKDIINGVYSRTDFGSNTQKKWNDC